MEALLDDVLLMVLRLLDDEDLLACRRVCRRLRSLAVHPYVWRHRSWWHSDSDVVLRVAPCLRYASLYLPSEKGSLVSLLYTTTECAVSHLDLRVERGGTAHAALAIWNQEALGRLRSVSVAMMSDEGDGDLPMLLWTIALVPGLEELVISLCLSLCSFDKLLTPSLHIGSVPNSSLKTFRVLFFSPEVETFCRFVLSTHVHTLEAVYLEAADDDDPTSSAQTAPLLSGMPNLSRLSCALLPGLEAVAACALLSEVTLYVLHSSADFLSAAAKFLRRAKQLRRVTLSYQSSTNGIGVDLVGALVSHGPSRVESLKIRLSEHFMGFPQLKSLLRTVPLMPALQKLELSAAPDELLMGITPATNPAMRRLKLHPGGPRDEDSGCAHSCLHRESMQTVLSRFPALELIVYCSYYCPPSESCVWCEEGCHREVWKKEWQEEWNKENPNTDWFSIPRIESISDDTV